MSRKTKCKRCGGTGIALRCWPIPRGMAKSHFIPCPYCVGKTVPIFKEISIEEEK